MLTFDSCVQKIQDDECFSLIRYCGGEWENIFPNLYSAQNYFYHPDVGKELRKTLLNIYDYNYYPAMQCREYLEKVGRYDTVMTWINENIPDVEWSRAEMFNAQVREGNLYPLVNTLNNKRVVAVGPPWHKDLPFIDDHISIPHRSVGHNQHCWYALDQILAKVAEVKDSVICLSAGMTAKVVINTLHPEMNAHSWLIDFGSLWDVFVGKLSRTYHRKLSKEIIKKNIKGES